MYASVGTNQYYETARVQGLVAAQEYAREYERLSCAGLVAGTRVSLYILNGAGNDVTNASAVSTPTVDAADLARREDRLRQQQADYQRRLRKYQRDLFAGYSERLSKHQSNVENHDSDVDALSR